MKQRIIIFWMMIACLLLAFIGCNPAGNDQIKVQTPEFNYPSATSFADSLVIEIAASPPEAKIYYTMDGSDPDMQSEPYTEGIVIKAETLQDIVIKAIAFVEKGEIFYSYISTAFYRPIVMREPDNPVNQTTTPFCFSNLSRSFLVIAP